MKIEVPKNTDVQNIVGDFGSMEATISNSSFPFLFRMLSSGLYSNPIGSICREITSNCFDAHTEAKIDDPVVIKYSYDGEGEYISFKDVGVGLSQMRMLKIYMKYFSSSKRKSNSLIGGFGLGSKTPLSYTDYFYITTIRNGKIFEYLYSKGEEKPTLDTLNGSEKRIIGGNIYHKIVDGINLPIIPPWEVEWATGDNTTKRNGTEIKIYIKSGDYYKFFTELKSQLCYFDNVYFDGWGIDNSYTIYENDLFKFRNKDHYSDNMHIAFGKVSYPIDWKAIGVDPISIPVGVKFQIGELKVTPNRESLQYTDEIKELVKTRVLETRKVLIEKFNLQNKPLTNFESWYELKDSKPYILFEGKDKMYLTGIKEIAKKFSYDLFKDIKFYYNLDHFKELYSIQKEIYAGKETKNKYRNTPSFITDFINNKENKYSVNDTFYLSNIKNAYFNYGHLLKRELSSRFKSRDFKFEFIKTYNKPLPNSIIYDSRGNTVKGIFGDGHTYFRLGFHKEAYNINRELRRIFEEKCCTDYNNVPKDFIDKYNQRKRENDANYQRKLQNKIHVKSIRNYNEFDINISGLERYTGIIIYGNREDKDKLIEAKNFMNNFYSFKEKHSHYESVMSNKSYEILLISKQNEKYFNKKTMVHVDNLYSDHILFRKIASCFKIKDFFKEIMNYQSSYKLNPYIENITKINNGTGELLKLLKRYLDENFQSGDSNDSFRNAVMKVAEDKNLFDPLVEGILEKLNLWYNGLEILKYTDINEDSLPSILKYLKEKKKKINYEYYLRYTLESKEENYIRRAQGQIIILFPDPDEEKGNQEYKSKFKVLTKNKISA